MPDKPEISTSTRRNPPVLLILGGLLAAGLAARLLMSFIVEGRLYGHWGLPNSAVAQCAYYVVVVSAASIALALAGKRMFNPTCGMLLGAVGGALAAAIHNPFLGLLQGGILGAVLVWSSAARFGALALRLGAALAAGASGAYVAVRIYYEAPAIAAWAPWLIVALTLLVVAVILSVRFRRREVADERLTFKRTAALTAWWVVCLLVVPLSLWCGLLLDTVDRLHKLNRAGWVQGTWHPPGAEWLWPGPFSPGAVNLYGDRNLGGVIAALPGYKAELQGLSCWEMQIDDDVLESLRSAKMLATIDSDRSTITDDGLAHLSQTPTLLNLKLQNSQIRGPGLAHLAGLPQLASLDLQGSLVDDSALPHIARMTAITDLNLDDTHITREGFVKLADLPYLASLRASSAQVTADDLLKFQAHSRMQVLSIGGANMDQRALKTLAAMRLTSLHIEGGSFTDDDLRHIAGMTSLLELRLDGAQIGDAGLAHLARMKGLQTLSLRNTQITDDGLPQLTRLKTLRDLNLDGTRVTAGGLRQLKPLPALINLSLLDVGFSDKSVGDLAELSEFPTLGYIYLRHSSFSLSAQRELRQTIRNSEIAWRDDPQP